MIKNHKKEPQEGGVCGVCGGLFHSKINVAHLNKKLGFCPANCFRDNLEKVFSLSNELWGLPYLSLYRLDLLILTLGNFDKFLGI